VLTSAVTVAPISFWRTEMPKATRRSVPNRWLLAAIAVSALMAGGLANSSTVASAASARQYSSPEWFPLRHQTNGSAIKVGCTYKSSGSQGGYECNGYHGWWALDLMATVGTPVYAAGAGQLSIVRQGNSGCSATSNALQINHGNGIRSYYTHLGTIKVRHGAWVNQNTRSEPLA
jgi:murein DD-endopeptidase MepM/ murein hydrolase activator NlpD